MPRVAYFTLSALLGYLLGAIPIGYLLVKAARGIDLRQVGSGRTGGTNSFRAAGVKVGILTSISDVLKASCGVWIVRALWAAEMPSLQPWLEVTAGVFSVVGHNWSVFLGWGGGAGTGPNVGWAGAIWFPIVPIAIVVVLGVIVTTGWASVASLAMAAAIPIAFYLLKTAGVGPYAAASAYWIGGVVTAALVAWALRPNIKRLLAGTERIVGPRAKRLQQKSQASP